MKTKVQGSYAMEKNSFHIRSFIHDLSQKKLVTKITNQDLEH